MNGEVWATGPDENGVVEVHIPPWIFRFSRSYDGKPILLSSFRTDKDRAYNEKDITPPPWLVKRATDLARIRFSTFGFKKPSKRENDGEQLPLPF